MKQTGSSLGTNHRPGKSLVGVSLGTESVLDKSQSTVLRLVIGEPLGAGLVLGKPLGTELALGDPQGTYTQT